MSAGSSKRLIAALALLLSAPAQCGIIAKIPAGRFRPVGDEWVLVSADGYHYGHIHLTRTKGEVVAKDGRVLAEEPVRVFSEDEALAMELKVSGAIGDNGRLAIVRKVLAPNGAEVGRQVWIDGRGGKVYQQVGGLAMTPDGRHLAFAAKTEGHWHLFLDNAPGPAFPSPPQSITFDPAGDRVAYIVDDGGGKALYIGSKRIRGWDLERLIFSPDWKRVAWLAKPGDYVGVNVGVDDDRLGHYAEVKEAQFSPDGKRFFFTAMESVDGQIKGFVFAEGARFGPPMDSMAQSIVVSPAGAAYWFGQVDKRRFLYREGVQAGSWDFVTGKPALAFSPSGAHWAFAAHRAQERLLFVDGRPEPGGPNVLQGNVHLVFDDEREFHYLNARFGAYDLVCASVGEAPAPEDSACVRKARAVYAGAGAAEDE